jgi:hypothetical protein
MPKSKTDKKRKKRVIAFKASIQSKRKKDRDEYIKTLQELQAKEMEEKVNAGQSESEDEGLGEFSLEESENTSSDQKIVNEFAEFGLDVEQVELSGAPPDSFAGVVK